MPKSDTLSLAEKILLKNPDQNAYILLRLRQGGAGRILIEGESACIWDKDHNKNLYCINSSEEFHKLYTKAEQWGEVTVSFASDIKWLPEIEALSQNIKTTVCCQLKSSAYAGTPPKTEGISFGDITEDTADWMVKVYSHPEITKEFILKRIQSSPGVAAYKNGKPAAFFITHSAAELGPAYIEPSLRGTGLADAIYAEMMLRVLKTGEAPIIFIMPDNHPSLKWTMRMGCTKTPADIVWFWRE